MDAGRFRRTDPCVVDQCPNTVTRTTLGICEAHYYRLRRHGSLQASIPIAPRADQNRARLCSIDGCRRQHSSNGYCDLHFQRWRKWGDPLHVEPAPVGELNPNWAGDDVTYSGAHQRVRRVRGPASDHPCTLCGDPAKQWSIIRTDGAPMPFSADPDDYRPLCVPCHKRYDLIALINEGLPHRPGY